MLPQPPVPRAHYRTLIADSDRWNDFEFRTDDIVISTPAKCGTTWTQMICAMLVLQTPRLQQPLDTYSPWLDMLTRSQRDVFTHLDSQTHRRFIKTHTPLDGLPRSAGVTYICVGRDPRDVALSTLNHRDNFDFTALLSARNDAVGLDDVAELLAAGPPPEADTVGGRFWQWIDNATDVTTSGTSLRSLTHHITTFWLCRHDPNVVMLHYDDLQTDLGGSMRMLAKRLNIAVPDSLWPGLVKAATFQEMRARASHLVPDSSHALWKSDEQFFNKGTSGQWQTVLNNEDRERYDNAIARLAEPDVIAWLHNT